NTEKVNDRNLILACVTQPAVIGRVRVLPHEGVIDRFAAFKNLAVDLALVVVPDSAAGLREYRLDGEKILHLLRLKDATLRIDERNPLAVENEAGPEFGRGQEIMDLHETADMVESGHAHLSVAARFIHARPFPFRRRLRHYRAAAFAVMEKMMAPRSGRRERRYGLHVGLWSGGTEELAPCQETPPVSPPDQPTARLTRDDPGPQRPHHHQNRGP